MGITDITWEEVSQYEEVKGYGQQIWRNNHHYFFVTEEGGIASQLVVYELSEELFQLLESGEKTIADIHFRLQEDRWPPTEKERRESRRKFILKGLTPLIGNPKSQELFTHTELETLIPLAEQRWIAAKGKLPDDYISPLK
ncbi:hypothetical protein BU202_01915 [Streptococcus cuniculi]|uniref:Uncharacterized protein n=1 Tax=Streptococcus cuniculi TaxID=1432788 RepID=A0A1Q8E9D2_9STRE|nr:hypothetical protein [Streptococcus cuniculi]OLF48398.1 hypothetical protein BU202_01915 [Streptococcus cuniculi]